MVGGGFEIFLVVAGRCGWFDGVAGWLLLFGGCCERFLGDCGLL